MTVYIPVVLAVVFLSSTLVYALNKNKLLNIQTILAISTGSVVLSIMFPFIVSMFAGYNAPQASNLGVLLALLLTIVAYITLILLLTILISSFISEKKAQEIQKSLENSGVAKMAQALSQLGRRWKEGRTAKAAETMVESDEQIGIATEIVENSEDVEITGIKTMEETQNILEKSVDSEQNIDKMGLGTFYPGPEGSDNNEEGPELLETGADFTISDDMVSDMTGDLQQEDGEYPLEIEELAVEEALVQDDGVELYEETDLVNEVPDVQEVDMEIAPVEEEPDAAEMEAQEIEVAEEAWGNIDLSVLDETESLDTVEIQDEVQEADTEPVPVEEAQGAAEMEALEIESAEETLEDVDLNVFDETESLDAVEIQDEVQEADTEPVPVEEQNVAELALQESAAGEELLEDAGTVLPDEPESRENEAESGGKEGMTEMNIDKSLSVDEYIDEAFRLKQCGDLEGAILHYMYSLDRNPDRGLVFWIILDICVLYKELGQAELAREILESYIASYGDVMDATVKVEIEKNLL